MRVLYLDANVWHINPTANLLPVLFREQLRSTVFYGPGFTPQAVLDMGLRKYVDSTGPYDAIVVGGNTPLLSEGEAGIEGSVTYIKRYTARDFDEVGLRPFFLDVKKSLKSVDIPIKLVSTLNFDYYAASERQIDILIDGDFRVLGPNDQFVLSLDKLPQFVKQEKHYIRKADRFSNIWYEFLMRNPQKVVTSVHFIGQQEFVETPLDCRQNDVAVPGVEYVLRKDAIRHLAGSQFRQASKAYFHAYQVANRIGLPVFSREASLRLYNLLFQKTLATTRCVYTAKGGFGIPIRKFFEIPAAGALLLCSPCNGYADLGFDSGKHYVSVEPELLLDALADWLRNPRAQEIAAAGRSLVLQNHSLAARGAQIVRCLDSLASGRYRGARWRRGEFLVEER